MDLTKGSIWQLLRKVTIPASTGSLFQTFYNLVDTYFAGRISPEALAAIAKSWPIYFIAIAVAVGIGAGTTALISNSIGAKEDRKASMYVAQSIILAIVVSIFVTLFGLNFSDELLRIMGSTEESIILTREYLEIFTFFLNIFLNPLFIFGYGFIPAFGIAGLAIATIVSQCIGLIYLANKVYCCKLKKFLYLECFKPKIDYLSSLFKQSVPIMFTMLMIMFGVFNIFYFVGQFGELATAGYGTAVRIEQVLLLPVIGLNTAVLSIAGQNFGAKMYFRVKEVYGKALMFGSGFMVLAGIFVYLTSEIIISFFTNDLEVIRRGALYLQVAALIGPVYPVFFITSALFQALKRPIYSLYMTILRLTLIPFMSLWYVINIRNGEYQDIFYTILVTNWMMGLVVLTFVPFFLKRVFRISFKKLFVF